MKRNLIEEIKGIKSRTEFNSRFDFSLRLKDIEYAFKESLDNKSNFDMELVKYIPISTVACFEAFFRSVYLELIDFGKPFSDNTIKFNQSKNVKFDFEIINAIQSKIVTVGEFIAHILPCNNFEDINSNLSTIADIDFLNSIKTFQKKSRFEHVNSNTEYFIENFSQIISDIIRTFELRHIFCHEFATNLKVDKDEIWRCFKNSKIFLNQTNQFVLSLIYPNAPETQTDMNISASEAFNKVDNELNELISMIKIAIIDIEGPVISPVQLEESINEWKKYSVIKARIDASGYKGGTLYPTIYANSLTSSTKEKITSLQTEYSYEIRKYASR